MLWFGHLAHLDARDDPMTMLSPRDQVLEKARKVVAGYAAARKHWNPASSLSSLLRQMQREREDRFLYELVQNAYDAHPPDADGNVAILLATDEGAHGVLYVANGGNPFSQEYFEAICELAQSNKTPAEIGNKGVGFKSVLQVCDWPEIFSGGNSELGKFEGFCFTFAWPEMYDDLTDGNAELADAMRCDVTSPRTSCLSRSTNSRRPSPSSRECLRDGRSAACQERGGAEGGRGVAR